MGKPKLTHVGPLCISKADGSQLRQIVKIQRLKGKVIVVSEGRVVTAYHQSNSRRMKKKSRIKRY